jgi:branched-chain amino acid aminotransferase
LKYTNINGKLVLAADARVAADNRAFRYGYGLFETMLCIDGQLQLASYHWQRLFEGMVQMYFDIPKLFTPDFLEAEVTKTISKNKLQKLCRVRLQVFPGSGGLFDGQSQQPQYVIECFEMEQSLLQLNEPGLVLGICHDMRKSNDAFANLKSCNALIYSIAAQQAKANKWNDTLICNTSGNIIESTIANIFWVKNNQLFTPHLYEGCVAGVMRRHIMDNFEVIEAPFSPLMLAMADEVLLSNAIRRIKWVRNVEDATYKMDYAVSMHAKLFL